MKYFNTAGPCDPAVHYMVPPEPRLPEVRELVERGMYLVVHAPRQTGKTTLLRALASSLTASGHFAALYFSCQSAQAFGDNVSAVEDIILQAMAQDSAALPEELRPPLPWPETPAGTRLSAGLRAWAQACPRALALLFDEIDAVHGASLLSVLGQLRASYDKRPGEFPASVVLCGLRDVRGLGEACEPSMGLSKAASGGDASRLGTSSPFNIKVESLRLGDFSEADLHELYAQHTAETGQVFTEGALARAWDYTQGQPWLLNALAREVVDKMKVPVAEAITAEHIDQARERLILARATHLDSLLAKLHDPRVRRILEPMIAGDTITADVNYDDDVSYVRDLGLIAADRPLRVANPIYQEIILRVLAGAAEDQVQARPRSFITADGRLDFDRLLHEFAEFWIENGDILGNRKEYHESAPHLVFMGYLHRLVNGGGSIAREYGIGRGRIDLLLRWPYPDADGTRAVQREAVELKVWHPGATDPLPKALTQLDGYLKRLGLDHGTLIIFDRRPTAGEIDERTQFESVETPGGRSVTLLRA